jgi:hypothetical protein
MFATITNTHEWERDDGVQPFLVVNSARDEIVLYESRHHSKVCRLRRSASDPLLSTTNIGFTGPESIHDKKVRCTERL